MEEIKLPVKNSFVSCTLIAKLTNTHTKHCYSLHYPSLHCHSSYFATPHVHSPDYHSSHLPSPHFSLHHTSSLQNLSFIPWSRAGVAPPQSCTPYSPLCKCWHYHFNFMGRSLPMPQNRACYLQIISKLCPIMHISWALPFSYELLL